MPKVASKAPIKGEISIDLYAVSGDDLVALKEVYTSSNFLTLSITLLSFAITILIGTPSLPISDSFKLSLYIMGCTLCFISLFLGMVWLYVYYTKSKSLMTRIKKNRISLALDEKTS